MMKRTASSGLIMSAIFTMVFQMLGDLSWSLITKQLVPLLVIILLSILGLVIGGAVGAKIMRCEPMLGIVASIGLFYFFPGVITFITALILKIATTILSFFNTSALLLLLLPS